MTNMEILNLFKNSVFPDFLGEDNVEEFIYSYVNFPKEFKFKWETGASKLVILPQDADFVIKIPFNGSYVPEQFDYETGEVLSEGGWEPFSAYEYYSDMEFDCNYCGREADISYMATEVDLEECFAITECIGKCGDYFIYKQARATCLLADVIEEKNSKLTNEESKSIREKCNNLGVYDFNVCWLKDFLAFFGEEILKQLNHFIEEYNINDLHSHNVGYIGNRPVLIDYSGYFE